jgi:alpha-tubulin suppressor-like RCC1 family protein
LKRIGLATLALAALMGASGCLKHGVFECREPKDCGPGGSCEFRILGGVRTGVCSVADPTCELSERRYQKNAPEELAGRCVEDACPADPVVEIRGGGAHACLVRQQGGVACWGEGSDGQLGDGTTTARSTIAAIAGFGTDGVGQVLHVALGARHTCALVAPAAGQPTGGVWCWGANEAGQLGDDTTAARAFPARVTGLGTDVVQIAAGSAFTCALKQDGASFCWGDNEDGQLGTGGPSSLTPSAVLLPEAAVSLTARDRHACAATTSQQVYCWGSNTQGELGDGSLLDKPTPTLVPALTGATSVAAGVSHTCALASDGIWCWGANQVGELGDGSSDSRAVPGLVSSLGAVLSLAAGAYHTCATKSDGTIWCWGANQAGQLGEGTTSNIDVPVPVNGIQRAAEVTAGDTFSCARRKDGTVACWGDNRQGQLGTAAVIRRLSPTAVADLADVQSVSAAGDHTCARRRGKAGASETWCWGHNQAGELGDGTRVDRPSPTALKVALDAATIAAGPSHSCLVASDGKLWCWGRGTSGQLGTATLIDRLVPTTVPGLTDVTAVAAGGAHTCAVRGGIVACWGADDQGQLGDGGTTNQSHPIDVPGLDGAIVVSLGDAHSCALRGDGTVACWGANDRGQLGDDSQDPSSVLPVTVGNLPGVIGIAAGARHTCAVDQSGNVSCWGAGTDGQIGWPPRLDHGAPGRVALPEPASAVEVAAGDRHTCARLAPDRAPETPGRVFCWGDNAQGQLGDGTLDPHAAPSTAPVLTDALAITAGKAHTCALRQDHTLVCWGSDQAGQLGEGAPLQISVPQPTQISCP